MTKALNLTPTDFACWSCSWSMSAKCYSRAQLLDRYQYRTVLTWQTCVIDSHIKNLRRKISDAAETGNRHEWIQAVYGVGYRFEYPEGLGYSDEIEESGSVWTDTAFFIDAEVRNFRVNNEDYWNERLG